MVASLSFVGLRCDQLGTETTPHHDPKPSDAWPQSSPNADWPNQLRAALYVIYNLIIEGQNASKGK